MAGRREVEESSMTSKTWWHPLVALFRGWQPVAKRPGSATIKRGTQAAHARTTLVKVTRAKVTQTKVNQTKVSQARASQAYSNGSGRWATDDSGSFSGLGGSLSQRTLQLQASTSAYPFHAVSIVPGAQACSSVYTFTGQRFLSRDAPRLPLTDCNSSSCTCKFKHHKDRRAGPRRRSDFGFGIALWKGSERRRGGGRRADDN